MKKSIQLFLLSFVFISLTKGQAYVATQLTVHNQLSPETFEVVAVVPGVIGSVGILDWSGIFDSNASLTLLAPSNTSFESNTIGEEFFIEPTTIDQRVKSWSVGLHGRFLYGADYWDSFLMGVMSGLDYSSESIEQSTEVAGVGYNYETKLNGIKFNGGISALYYLTEVFGVNADLCYYYSYAFGGFSSPSYSDTFGFNNGVALNLGVTYFFD